MVCILLYTWTVIIRSIMQNSISKYIIVHPMAEFRGIIANTGHVRKAICGFNWDRCFANKDVNKNGQYFQWNCISCLKQLYSSGDYNLWWSRSPWINIKIKKAIQNQVKSNINNYTFLKKFQCLQNKFNDLINIIKRQY